MTTAVTERHEQAWPAIWALVIGFFMILVDTTIVSVATPAILEHFQTDITTALWVTSAYLLTYAVPLLVSGRLGDQFGPKNVYLAGLLIFTAASVWCGLSGTIGMLIAARATQGIGASLMTPQTMAVITRLFPANERGKAMGLWGATAGAATLTGPVLGGILTDVLDWRWIFFVNVPVGVIAWILAFRQVPALPTHQHRFDLIGMVLSAGAVFLIVFGLEEGDHYEWGTVSGPITVWRMLIVGVVLLALFVAWQARSRREPLVPLQLFTDRNFSLANIGITVMGAVITAMSFPLMFYAQGAEGLSPTQSGLLMVPLAVLSGALAPLVGQQIDKRDPRLFVVAGFLLLAVSLWLYGLLMDPSRSVLWLLLPATLLGVANALIWSPLSVSATRNLSPARAGAGAGVYNTTRQVGAVIGSAAIAALISSRIAAHLPSASGTEQMAVGAGGPMPSRVAGPFATALAESLWLPIGAALLGAVAVFFLAPPSHGSHEPAAPPRP